MRFISHITAQEFMCIVCITTENDETKEIVGHESIVTVQTFTHDLAMRHMPEFCWTVVE